MPLICYTRKTFNAQHQGIIEQANTILNEYRAAGFVLTLRQLYYQFVQRDWFPDSWRDPATGSTNNMRSYKKLGDILNDARLAGLVDWSMMEDRTRNVVVPSTWTDPANIIASCADCFRLDKWKKQPYRPEVWIEKDALAGVFERVCSELQVPYFSCRGYTSQSEMWAAGQRLRGHMRRGQTPIIFHFGDHDPSGMDMTRDIVDRLTIFMGGVELERLALNMGQVEEYEPPPNPAKVTDSRAAAYIAEYGDESWELDALNPETLAALVRDAILGVREEGAWQEAEEQEEEHRRLLRVVSNQWETITDNL